MTRMPHLEETILATTRYLAALTDLTDEDCRAPSALPGWSRGHVITHLSRNADGLSNLLHSAQTGVEHPMYSSTESRNADIERGAVRSAEELREDASASAGRFLQAANELHRDHLEAPVVRMAGADPFPVHRVGMLRWTELEVHHADLLIGYTAADWPEAFTHAHLEKRHEELVASGPPMTWKLTDTGETLTVAGGGPVIHGTAADLVWWAIGRGHGEGLAVEEGAPLPKIEKWR